MNPFEELVEQEGDTNKKYAAATLFFMSLKKMAVAKSSLKPTKLEKPKEYKAGKSLLKSTKAPKVKAKAAKDLAKAEKGKPVKHLDEKSKRDLVAKLKKLKITNPYGA